MAVEVFLMAIAWPVAAGLLLSFAVEFLLTPRPEAPWKRPVATSFLHLGLWLFLFSILLVALGRPWFASAVASAFLLLIVLVSQAKFHSLREPFVFQDFEYFTDAIRHPRLYLPFLGWSKALLATVGFVAAIYVGLTLESSLYGRFSREILLAGMGGLSMLAAILAVLGGKGMPKPCFEPSSDLARLGLLSSLWAYGWAEQSVPVLRSPYQSLEPARPAGELPTLVVVQSESFFDPRKIFPGIRPEILAEWDAVCAESVQHGELAVPAWGANTVRSEFAFLSGLGESSLGVHRFNPYRRLSRSGVTTLAGFLKGLGYKTVCIHPYPAGFYRRDQVFPRFGFDEFIDIRQFADAQRSGPYVGDLAVADEVKAVLEANRGQPVFVFVITMENHGPLHLETVSDEDLARFHSVPPPAGCEDLTVYLRHLANAGKMAGALRSTLEALPGDGWLGWFGDHVPIMPEVYKRLGVPPAQTEYLLWHREGRSSQQSPVGLKIEELGLLLLRQAGLAMK